MSELDTTTGAPFRIRAIVAGAKTRKDKLATLRTLYPDAVEYGPDNFKYYDHARGKMMLFDEEKKILGFNAPTMGDVADVLPEIGEAAGAVTGAVVGVPGGIPGVAAMSGVGAGIGRSGVNTLLQRMGARETRGGLEQTLDTAKTVGINAAFGGAAGAAEQAIAKQIAKNVYGVGGREAERLVPRIQSTQPVVAKKPEQGGLPAFPQREMMPDEVIAERVMSDKAGNLNLQYIDSDESAKNVLASVAKKFEGQIDEARRGKITDEQLRGLADDLHMTPGELLARRKGQAFNAEQALASRRMLVTSAEDLHTLALAAKRGAPDDVLRFRRALDVHVALEEQVMGMTAEAGRALRSFQIPAGSANEMRELISTLGGSQHIDEIADALLTLEPWQIGSFARQARKATTADMLVEAWKAALLSSPPTHAVNAISNGLVQLLTIPETATAAMIGKLTPSVLHKGDQVLMREAPARLYGTLKGVKDGLRVAAAAMRDDIPLGQASKLDSRYNSIPGKAGYVIRTPLRALQAADQFAKTTAGRAELYALGTRSGIEAGLAGKALAKHVADFVASPPEAALQAAAKHAQYVTFQSPLGEAGKSILQFRNSHPAFNLIVPFFKTPANIVKFFGERTPLALAMKDVRAAIAEGGASRDMALGRIAMGGSIMSAVMLEAEKGNITGGGPADPTTRRLWLQNNQPYSWKVGDQWYSYSRVEPVGMLVGVAADAHSIWGQMEEGEREHLALGVAVAASRNVLSKTWLEGMSSALDAIEDPERHGPQFIRNLAGTVIPTVVAQAERVSDPTLREVQSSLDQIKSRVPGWSESLPARLNLWGEPIVMRGAWGPDMISPIYSFDGKQDPVVSEMLRLKINVDLPDKKIGDVELSGKDYWGYVEAAGRPAKEQLDYMVNDPKWPAIPDFVKEILIRKKIAAYREIARGRIVAEQIGAGNLLEVKPKIKQVTGAQ